MGNKAVPMLQQATNKDPELFIEERVQITAAVYIICETIVRFSTRLGNILYFTSRPGNRTADTKGVKRMRVCKE